MGDTRSMEQIKEHYLIEVELAERLRNAPQERRGPLYIEVYEELFARVPHHPQVTGKATPDERKRKVRQKMKLLSRFLRPEHAYMELGPGDCAMAVEVARHVKSVLAVDVSESIASGRDLPPNFTLAISDGTDIPVEGESIDIAFSDQLMEHLHPDDAYDQLRGVFDALAPGGTYVCITPNRLSGPHDVSAAFDDEARGLHLKEYDLRELRRLFESIGFQSFRVYVGGKGVYLRMPVKLVEVLESVIQHLGPRWRRSFVSRAILGINLVATKR